jgi:hypothetical protein
MKPSPWLFVSLAFFALAAACAGGGSTPVPRPGDPNGSGSSAKLDQSVKFTVVVPKSAGTSSHRRKTKSTVYVSPNTESITIQIGAVDGVSVKQPPAPTVANVPANCIGSQGGCSVAVPDVVAAVGTDTFVVSTFAGTGGSGTLISQGVVALQVSAGGSAGTIGGTTLSLGGFVQSIGLTVTPDYFIRGQQGNAQIVVEAKDATGAIIIGNTQFAVPIALGATPSPQLQVTGLPFRSGVPVLTGPQGTGIIALHYNGSFNVTIGQVAAKSTSSNGATISASVTVSVLTSPPPPTPTPTPSGFTPPPQDVYIVNGEDNTIEDLGGAESPRPSATPVRSFGGYGVVGCKPALKGLTQLSAAALGVSGLSFDGSGNALLGNGEACNKQDIFYQFAPNASGKATPSATYPTNESVLGNFIALYHDPSTGYLDVSDGSQSAYLSEYLPGPSGAQLIALFGTLGLTAQGTCILTPGVAGCTNPPTTNTFVSAPLGQDLSDQFSRTFTIDGHGNYFYPAKDSTLYNMSIVEIPSNQVIPVEDPIANAPWLRGINTFVQTYQGIDADRVSNYPSGLAVDGTTLFVLNSPFTGLAFGQGGKRLTNYYAPAAACNPNSNATPSPISQCSDGTPHEYLTAYDLTQLTQAGPNDLEPILVVGGNAFPGGAAAGSVFGNRLAVSGGNVFLADPAGLECNAACFTAIGSLGKTPVGQVSVYQENLRGVHIGDGASSPHAILSGKAVKFPTGVAPGQAGTAK